MKLIYQFLFSRRKSIVFYSRIMAITRSDELRHSPPAHDTKSSSRVLAIIIHSLNNTYILLLILIVKKGRVKKEYRPGFA
jgi:hypothetical protein